MIIAVNTRLLIPGQLEGCGYFIHEVSRIMAEKHPEHQFYFLFDRPYDPVFVFGENITPIVLTPPARHPILWKYWFDLKVPAVLRKIKADVFLSADGFCSLATRIPQCLVVHDLGFLRFPSAYKKSHRIFYKHYVPRFISKSRTVATVSEFSKADIVQTYHTPADRIRVVYSAAKDRFKPLSWEEKDKIKEKYTEGREFFIYVGAIQPRKNLMNLLKAFSLFKKRQQTNMKLVLAGRVAWKSGDFLELLRTYKYRQDVVLTHYLPEDELAQLTASAYALVYPSVFEGFGVPVLEGMKCDVPVLTSKDSSMAEIGGTAALYFDPQDPKDIADRLMLIYKDERLRSELITKGRTVAENYSWEKTSDALWESVLEAVGDNRQPLTDTR
jgi:glycosyltransferase involved in cell wall biosynthesis